MVFIYTSGDAGDGSPGILIPVRRAQTGKGGNYIAAVRIRNFGELPVSAAYGVSVSC